MKLQLPLVRTILYSFAAIAMLFLFMKLACHESQIWLRILNVIFVVYFAYRLARYLHESCADNDNFRAWGSLMVSNVITIALSFVSIVIYAVFIYPGFMEHFTGDILWNNHINIQQVALTLFTEGIGLAVVISFIVIQYWNNAAPAKTN